jgi:sugar phosphate isomerase/epimerase
MTTRVYAGPGRKCKSYAGNTSYKIMMLQPLSQFGGWKKGSKERENAFQRARGWIRIMQSVGTDLLQVGSSDATGISTAPEDIIHDLRELADMLAEHKFRLAYENWSWSTHACVLPHPPVSKQY